MPRGDFPHHLQRAFRSEAQSAGRRHRALRGLRLRGLQPYREGDGRGLHAGADCAQDAFLHAALAAGAGGDAGHRPASGAALAPRGRREYSFPRRLRLGLLHVGVEHRDMEPRRGEGEQPYLHHTAADDALFRACARRAHNALRGSGRRADSRRRVYFPESKKVTARGRLRRAACS